ncbi:excisionase family DNA-binding protein [Microbacterium arborescens]|uniref:excisionase family DNA-binding protein n=1 Tax=Microbacterium arborescens TaxID=33883 RepID=UPI0027834C5B|nr:excisionase family DNA-binding protein [Microbacterium arborescens]MDQ1215463.1 excisionase family DNA binding protein [Microbacterium arborescens]
MSTATLDMVTPAPEERERTARVVSFVDAHLAQLRSTQTPSPAPAPTPDFYLSGPDEHDRVELTEPLFRILKDVAEALSQGRSVSIVARDKEISTQQAADLLGISRPTVVKLIEQGELRATIPGEQRRKLRLADVLAYRDRLYEARGNFIAESSQAYDDVDPDEAAAFIEAARKAH